MCSRPNPTGTISGPFRRAPWTTLARPCLTSNSRLSNPGWSLSVRPRAYSAALERIVVAFPESTYLAAQKEGEGLVSSDDTRF